MPSLVRKLIIPETITQFELLLRELARRLTDHEPILFNAEDANFLIVQEAVPAPGVLPNGAPSDRAPIQQLRAIKLVSTDNPYVAHWRWQTEVTLAQFATRHGWRLANGQLDMEVVEL